MTGKKQSYLVTRDVISPDLSNTWLRDPELSSCDLFRLCSILVLLRCLWRHSVCTPWPETSSDAVSLCATSLCYSLTSLLVSSVTTSCLSSRQDSQKMHSSTISGVQSGRKHIAHVFKQYTKLTRRFQTLLRSRKCLIGYSSVLTYNNVSEASPDFEKADLFCNFLNSVFKNNIADNIPYVSIKLDNVFSVLVDVDSVRKELLCINTNKTIRCGDIPNIFLRECANELAIPITILFNCSIKEGIFLIFGNEPLTPFSNQEVDLRLKIID